MAYNATAPPGEVASKNPGGADARLSANTRLDLLPAATEQPESLREVAAVGNQKGDERIRRNFEIALAKSSFKTLGEWCRAIPGMHHGKFYQYVRGEIYPQVDTALRILKPVQGLAVEDIWGCLQNDPPKERKPRRPYIPLTLKVEDAEETPQ